MTRLLTPPQEKLRRNGVASVQSRVANLQDFAPGLTVAALKEKIAAAFACGAPRAFDDAAQASIDALAQKKYANPAWNFAK